jgi:dephospho-CoA kinase
MASRKPLLEGAGKAQPIPVIGLTGGIACGKSTVLAELGALGALCFDADSLYGDLVRPGAPLLRRIAGEFGDEALTPDGALDRPFLGKLIFNDEAARANLNRITHPAILGSLSQRLEEAKGQGWRWAIFEAAILVEGNAWKAMDLLVVVSAPAEMREQRIVARDKLSPEDARSRISAQAPLESYEVNADHILRNKGELKYLRSSVETLFHMLVKRFGAPKSIL